MSESLNWHDLEILHAVLEHNSFSGAARSLGLSQPTVSRHVDALERKLGRELFVRGHGGPEPNELALTLAGHTARMSEGMYATPGYLERLATVTGARLSATRDAGLAPGVPADVVDNALLPAPQCPHTRGLGLVVGTPARGF